MIIGVSGVVIAFKCGCAVRAYFVRGSVLNSCNTEMRRCKIKRGWTGAMRSIQKLVLDAVDF